MKICCFFLNVSQQQQQRKITICKPLAFDSWCIFIYIEWSSFLFLFFFFFFFLSVLIGKPSFVRNTLTVWYKTLITDIVESFEIRSLSLFFFSFLFFFSLWTRTQCVCPSTETNVLFAMTVIIDWLNSISLFILNRIGNYSKCVKGTFRV